MQKTKKRQSLSFIMAAIIAMVFAVMPALSIQVSAEAVTIISDTSVISAAKLYKTDATKSAYSSAKVSGTAYAINATSNLFTKDNMYALEVTFKKKVEFSKYKVALSVSGKDFAYATTLSTSSTSLGITGVNTTATEVTSAVKGTKVYIPFALTSEFFAADDNPNLVFTLTLKTPTEEEADKVTAYTVTIPGAHSKEKGVIDTLSTLTFHNGVSASASTEVDLIKNSVFYVGYEIQDTIGDNYPLKISALANKKAVPGIKFGAGTKTRAAADTAALASGTYTIKDLGTTDKVSDVIYFPVALTTESTTSTDIVFQITAKIKGKSVVVGEGTYTVKSVKLAEIGTNNITISNIAFDGVKKNSSLTIAYSKDTGEPDVLKNATIYFVKSGVTAPYTLATKVDITSGKKYVLKNAKFAAFPTASDKIRIVTDSYSWEKALTVADFKAVPPAPTVTVKGIGEDAAFTIKAEKDAVLSIATTNSTTDNLYGKTTPLTAASVIVKASEFTTANKANAVSSGTVYVSYKVPGVYGDEYSPVVAVNFGSGAQTVAPTASVTGINEVTLSLTGISLADTIKIYNGATEVTDKVAVSTGTKANTVKCDVKDLDAGSYNLHFTVASGNKAVSPKSNVVRISVNKTPTSLTPAKIVGQTTNVLVNNLIGTADQIIVGAVPQASKILVFALPKGATAADYISGSNMKYDATGKIWDSTAGTAGAFTTVSPYYTGISGSAAVGKETTIKTDLSAWVGYDLYFYVVSTAKTDAYDSVFAQSDAINVGKEGTSSAWSPKLKVASFTGDATMTVVVTGDSYDILKIGRAHV